MKIALLGDIALFGQMSINGNPNVSVYFSKVAEFLEQFDYVVGNLETPFSEKKRTYGAKSAYICSDVENIVTLQQLHINAVCLANNHIFDFGEEGHTTTKKILKESNIEWFGTEGKELLVEYANNKIAFNGFCCYSTNPLRCVPYGNYGVNAYNIEEVAKVIKKNDNNSYFNIVAVHAGLEHVNFPSIDHIRAARKLAAISPYVYYGHHPHVIQGIEEFNGSLLAHSLGNFCFDDVYTTASASSPLISMTENNRTGIILSLTIDNNRIIDWKEHLLYISKGDNMYLIEDTQSLMVYNTALSHCQEDVVAYSSHRKDILLQRAEDRKAMRNAEWYFKRLRPKYVKLFLDGRHNIKLYNENVKQYI